MEKGHSLLLVGVYLESEQIWVDLFGFRLHFAGFMDCRRALADIRMSGESKFNTVKFTVPIKN